jgi:hypothetical protein
MHRRIAPLLASLVFALTGIALIPWPGLQNDELFFAAPIYQGDTAFYFLNFFGARFPLMVMSYSGALKTWLYWVILHVFRPSIWTVRVPMLLAGIASLWLTWVWVKRIATPRAAAFTVFLLATDSMFFITNVFDWGPVALQHLLLLSGLVACHRWLVTDSRRALAWAFFFWGLGMWDKALLAWPLIGLAVATVCVYPRELFRRLRIATLGVAMASFLLGAMPLAWYNIARPGETASANTKFSSEGIEDKLTVLKATVNGSALLGYMTAPDAAPPTAAPNRAVTRAAAALARVTPGLYRNWMLQALEISGLLGIILLFRGPRKLLLFLVITTVVAWLQMAFNKGTGGASHHIILLWPFPAIFIGIVADGTARCLPKLAQCLVIAAITTVCVVNLLNTNLYLKRFVTHGGSTIWTDAIIPLTRQFQPGEPGWVGLVDWGYYNALILMHEGKVPLFTAEPNPGLDDQLAATDFRFIQHVPGREIQAGNNARLAEVAAQKGYTEIVDRIVNDSHGRPVFEIFHFRRISGSP